MMLGFLDFPMVKGPRWLRYGGMNTLGSFGIGGITTSSSEAEFEEKAAALYEAMGPEMVDWLRDLPTKWESGNVVVVHAAADPALPIALQAEKTLKWGHPDFFRLARTDVNGVFMRVLVTGGAGYIGSHTLVELLGQAHEVCVLDNYDNSSPAVLDRVRKLTNGPLTAFEGDIRDASKLDQVMSEFQPDVVIHFAGLKAVGDSMTNPLGYYDVNVRGTLQLLAA